MRLADPYYLGLLVLLPILFWLFIRGRIGKEAAVRFSNVGIVQSAGIHSISWRRFLIGLLRVACLTLLVVALARPQTGEGKSESTKEVVDVMLALDVSSSMATLDFEPENRLEAAKVEASRFVASRPDDRVGLVAFAKGSFTVSPLTTDHSALLSLLNTIQMGIIEDGTAIGVGLANALNRLKDSEAKSKVAILLTDGVNNSGEIDPVTAGAIAQKLGIRVYTIGMGKDGPAMVPVNHPQYGRRLVQVYTEIDEELLRSISEKTGGAYFRARDEGGLRRIFDEISKLERTDIKVHTYTTYNDHYPIFIQWALWIFALEILLFHLIWRKVP